MIFEENLQGTAFIVGRFQPITKLHHEIIDDARKKYQQVFVVVVNPGPPPKSKQYTKKGEIRTPEKSRREKNPLSLQMRVDLIHSSFEGKIDKNHIIASKSGFTPDVIKQIVRYTSKKSLKQKIVLLAGSDRIPEYKRQLEKYLDEIDADVEIKEISRDMDSADNVSATKVRQALYSNDKRAFQSLTPQGIHDKFDELKQQIVVESASLFDKLIEELSTDENKKSLHEGGLGGHIAHPSDDMSKEQFIKFFDNLISGKLGATEKVDGINLFVGFDENGQVVAARNKTEKPVSDINKKFRMSHGARGGFVGGFKALKSMLQKLSPSDRQKYHLTDENGDPKNFLNLEIIYGLQPNVVPYSKDTNYIVLHSLSGNPQNNYKSVVGQDVDQRKILKQLSQKLDSTTSIQSEVEFIEEAVKRKFKTKESYWQAKGPIQFTKDQMKKMVSDPQIQKTWEKRKEELKNFEGSDEELRDKMKSIALEIGSMILKGSKSKLSDVAPKEGQPGVEGFVVPYNDKLYKITGDFGSIYQNLERPPDFLKDLKSLVGEKILKIKLKKIDKKAIDKYGNLDKLLAARNPKFDYSQKFDQKDQIISEIEKAEEAIQEYKKTSDLKGIDASFMNSTLYDLQEFKKQIKKASTYKDVARAFFETLFWQRSKLSEGLKNILQKI